MRLHDDLLHPLLTGLPEDYRVQIAEAIRRTHDEQLNRKIDPPRRRRRAADGVLCWPGESA